MPCYVHSGRSLTQKKKVFCYTVFPKKPAGTPWLVAVGGWRRLAVGSWRLAVGGGWWLVIGGWWRLVVVGGWWELAVGGWWFLGAVFEGGP